MEYLDPKMGPVRTYPSKEAALAWEEIKQKVIKELYEDGYTFLDPYGRPVSL